jgi:hypothetical protein
MNRLFRNLLYLKTKKYLKQSEMPLEIQSVYLRILLSNNKDTEIGKHYKFANILQSKDLVKAYQDSLPIHTYSSFEPWIKKIKEGKKNILTREPVKFFNLTSGTEGRPKYIPVTGSFESGAKELLHAWVGALLRDHPEAFTGSRFAIPGRATEGYTLSGIPYGSASGRAYRSAFWYIRNKYTIPYEVFEIEDYDIRYLLIAYFALHSDITYIATPNSGTLVRILEIIQERIELLIEILEKGLSSLDSTHLPDKILGWKGKDSSIARKLKENIQKNQGRFSPKEYWSNIKLISVWLGGSCASQVNSLREWFPGIPIRDFGYHASEARMSLPIQDNIPDGILAFRNNFYEFIPENIYEISKESRDKYQGLTADKLESGKYYYVIISNTSGLYRYDLGDLIQVVGFYQTTPIIRFIRKGRDFRNLTGEKLHINQFLEAKSKFAKRFPGFLSDDRFFIFPNPEKNRYEIYLELNSEIPGIPDMRANLSDYWDFQISELNIEYKSKRKSGRLSQIQIFYLKNGTIRNLVDSKFRLGIRDTQYKWNYFLTNPPEQEFLLTPVAK